MYCMHGPCGNGLPIPPDRWYVLNLASFKFATNKIVMSLEQNQSLAAYYPDQYLTLSKHSDWTWIQERLDFERSRSNNPVREILRDDETKKHLIVYAVTKQYFNSYNPTKMEVFGRFLKSVLLVSHSLHQIIKDRNRPFA